MTPPRASGSAMGAIAGRRSVTEVMASSLVARHRRLAAHNGIYEQGFSYHIVYILGNIFSRYIKFCVLWGPVKFFLISVVGLGLGWFFAIRLGWTAIMVPFFGSVEGPVRIVYCFLPHYDRACRKIRSLYNLYKIFNRPVTWSARQLVLAILMLKNCSLVLLLS